ncbi:FecR family protein [Mucilaginibacter gossypii]|uniref:Ferric-dicitrate binding protein FerR, regulates iron transport through sigma-19 n=1 Tax=Mucilaginibacter gossypii TaxID=551996 RepID=A0A1G7S211_9SPHI|nr:FecR family protein [Mucilaginibacter gossypii]SDG16479.1 ferric-dicitrate binding protein FerR, regulates iron transport through sigma-19 [Mucilaginibacter gossypii]
MEDEHLQSLAKKYLSGTATEAEKAELHTWYRLKEGEDLILPYLDQREEAEARERMYKNLKQKMDDADGEQHRPKTLKFRLAAAAIVLLGIAMSFYYLNIYHSGGQLRLVTTKSGEHKKIELTDGTLIYLSSESKLSYPVAFKGNTREVILEGEAFFEVAKDKSKPFILHTGKLTTKVLGTSFNVDAILSHPDVTVALISGRVMFSDGNAQAVLKPNFQVVYNKSKKLPRIETIPDSAALIGRHKGSFEYKNTPLEQVIEDLNRNFNTHAVVIGAVKNCTFFGRIKEGESPEQFLNKLGIIMDATVTGKNGGYVIKGKGGGCR